MKDVPSKDDSVLYVGAQVFHERQISEIDAGVEGATAGMKKKRMAEEVRFELTEPAKVQRFSRPPDSTTLAPLRKTLV